MHTDWCRMYGHAHTDDWSMQLTPLMNVQTFQEEVVFLLGPLKVELCGRVAGVALVDVSAFGFGSRVFGFRGGSRLVDPSSWTLPLSSAAWLVSYKIGVGVAVAACPGCWRHSRRCFTGARFDPFHGHGHPVLPKTPGRGDMAMVVPRYSFCVRTACAQQCGASFSLSLSHVVSTESLRLWGVF